MNTKRITTELDKAAALLRDGGLVAVPTETVYGLAGNGLDVAAVEQIYEVKGRPAVKPLSLMIPGMEFIDRVCDDVPPAAYLLAKRFWPGPLTIVLKAKPVVPEIVRAGGSTVGLRCPDHPATLEALRLAGVPFAAPSANPSGAPSPKTADEVLRYFDGQIAAVIDGGPCGIGTESTIVDLSQTPYRILRPGALPEEQVWQTLVDDMTIIGVTGGTGCGKTTALEAFSERGALVLDCDAVYHELLETDTKLLAEIKARFPGVVENGRLERKRLGAIVFQDESALSDLNAITHKYISAALHKRLIDFALSGGRAAAIDAVALIESGLGEMCDLVIGVTAPREERIRRVMAREGISEIYAAARVDAQKSDKWYAEHCDQILENSGTLAAFEAKCRMLSMEVIK
ncbi:MAG: L-threonylcarbamoyladenylate synthase [Clostridia bacterium]